MKGIKTLCYQENVKDYLACALKKDVRHVMHSGRVLLPNNYQF